MGASAVVGCPKSGNPVTRLPASVACSNADLSMQIWPDAEF